MLNHQSSSDLGSYQKARDNSIGSFANAAVTITMVADGKVRGGLGKTDTITGCVESDSTYGALNQAVQ